VRTRMFMLALVLGSSGRFVRAQGDDPTHPAHPTQPALPALRYEAPAGCPDRNFFEARMRARLRADGVAALSSLSLIVKLDVGAQVRGTVEISRGSTRAARNLEGESCREVVEGLALIAALAVGVPDPPADSERTSTPAVPPSQASAAHMPTTARARASQAHGRSAAAPPSAATTTQPAAAEAARSEAPAPPAPPAQQASSDQRDLAPSPEDSASPPRETGGDAQNDLRIRGFSLAASVLAVQGLAPAIQPGLQLEAAFTLAEGALDWSIRAGGRIALDESLQSRQGLARFGFAAGLMRLCAKGALGPAGLALAGCAVAEPGILSTSGDNTSNPHSYTRAWLAAGAGAELSWRAASWLAVQLGAEAVVPTQRYRMFLADQLLHRVPPACLRLQLGVEVPLG
jgi:hypothetical protein